MHNALSSWLELVLMWFDLRKIIDIVSSEHIQDSSCQGWCISQHHQCFISAHALIDEYLGHEKVILELHFLYVFIEQSLVHLP